MKDLSKVVFTVLGAVIGAGFSSGREILSFFAGFDPLISAILFFFLFSAILLILFFDKSYASSKFFSCAKPLIYVADLILASGMLSALDRLYYGLFPNLVGIPMLSVVFMIISVIVVSGGVEGLKSANLFFTPIVIAIMSAALMFTVNDDSAAGGVSVVNVCKYVGLNAFTSCVLFTDMAKVVKTKTKIISVLISSLVLSALIYFTLRAFSGKSEDVLNADIPFLALLGGQKIFYCVFCAALALGIVTTLFACHYPLYELVKTKKCNFFTQSLLCLLIFGVSRLGFYNIVSFVYPVIGGISFFYFGASWVIFRLLIFSRSKRRKNTLKPQERKVLPYSSLRDRV